MRTESRYIPTKTTAYGGYRSEAGGKHMPRHNSHYIPEPQGELQENQFQRRTHKTKNINNTKTASICLTLEGLYIRYGEWLLLYSHFKWLFYKYIQLSGHFNNTDVVSSTIGALLFEDVQKALNLLLKVRCGHKIQRNSF